MHLGYDVGICKFLERYMRTCSAQGGCRRRQNYDPPCNGPSQWKGGHSLKGGEG